MVRPTVSISTKITANNTTPSPPATARGMFVFACQQPQAETTAVTHSMSGVTFGGKALTAAQAPLTNSAHMCGWYLDNYANFRGRASNTLAFSGGTMGAVQNTYSAWVCWILHPTHTTTFAAAASNAANVAAGSNLQATPAPGSVDVLSVINWLCASATTSTPRTSQTSILTNSAITNKIVSTSWRDVTGSVAVGYDVSAISGFNRCALIASTWKEGTPIAKAQGGRFWIFGALPAVSLPALPLGLAAARSVPAA